METAAAACGAIVFAEVNLAPSLDISVALIPIAPFLAAFMAPFIFRFTGSAAGWILAIVPASIFIFLLGFIVPIAHESQYFHLPWIGASGDGDGSFLGQIDLTFFIDGLSLTFGLLISGIGTIIVIYSGAYLKGHRHQGRFFAFILMFMGSMLGLVLTDNLIVLFVFWELTSITSFLLIGFDHTRQAARRAAIQALVITSGGGLVLLVGIVILHLLTIDAGGADGTWSIADLRQYPDIIRQSALYLPVMLMFIAGAFTKSAQFPFHFWLPNAMEAPTPVSAFLHSATMVKAGIYLLARMNPVLGNTPQWQAILIFFGGITLLWGATLALRQTDLKQMLAQTTVASLGLLVLLIGIGTETAIAGAVIYLAAHAFYKAALFLVTGLIDHGTGTREIIELGGLRSVMPLTFLAALLSGAAMAGLPLTLGFLAKEEMYAALTSGEYWIYLPMIAVIVGNALMMAVGLAIGILPFFGGRKPTPIEPHEGSFALFGGPVLLGVFAVLAGISVYELGEFFLAPTGTAIFGDNIGGHIALLPDFTHAPIYLSVLTWILGSVIFFKLDMIRSTLKRLEDRINWNFDKGFDAAMFGLIRMSDAITRFLHHGRLEFYLIVVFVALAAALFVPILATGSVPAIGPLPVLTVYEWGVILIALIGLTSVIVARTRLVAIVSLGIQGFAVALIFMLFGAPDLSFTQFMVEVLSVVILALVMTRLHLNQGDRRMLEPAIRDGAVALVCAVGISMLLLVVLQTPLDMHLTDLFAATSVPVAHGHNVVNVILVDYRGLDTLGEISVVMTAGIAIFALIRMRGGGPQTGVGLLKRKRRARKAKRAGA